MVVGAGRRGTTNARTHETGASITGMSEPTAEPPPPLTDAEAATARLRRANLLDLAGVVPRSPDVLLARYALQLERERDTLEGDVESVRVRRVLEVPSSSTLRAMQTYIVIEEGETVGPYGKPVEADGPVAAVQRWMAEDINEDPPSEWARVGPRFVRVEQGADVWRFRATARVAIDVEARAAPIALDPVLP